MATLLQCSCLENPMDRGAWRAAVHGVAKGRTRLSTHAEQSGSGRSLAPVHIPGKGWRCCCMTSATSLGLGFPAGCVWCRIFALHPALPASHQ